MNHIDLILASRSPRRAQLLNEAGFEFVQHVPPFDDPPHPKALGQTPKQVAIELAKAKAQSLATTAFWKKYHHPFLIAADSLIALPNGELAGTPTSARQAKQMIQKFVEADHQVVTGVALLDADMAAPYCFGDAAKVTLGAITATQIDQYLETDQWQGKAGGYNLFERQQAGWPIQVLGDPTTVVGLPMKLLLNQLQNFGIMPQSANTSASTQLRQQ